MVKKTGNTARSSRKMKRTERRSIRLDFAQRELKVVA
jgi:hypothetical protein